MLERIDKTTSRAGNLLNEKEKSFLSSIREQWIVKGSLSWSQERWFENIEKKYSESEIAIAKLWTDQWDDSKRVIALQCAKYYEANPPYFSNIIHRILSDSKNFVLTKREWDKLCENKYALKVRKTYSEPAKFKNGDCVQIRKTNRISKSNYNDVPIHELRSLSNRVGFVTKVDAKPVTRAAKGSRVYQILLAGMTRPLFVYESDLKKKRG